MHPLLSELQSKDQIIWDWNGTLLADLEHNVRIMNMLLASAGLPLITAEQHRQQFRFPVVEYYETLGFDTSQDNFVILCKDFSDAYNEGISNCGLAPGILEIVQSLKLSGKTQSVLSAARQDSLDWAIAQFGLSNVFQFVFGIEDNRASSKLERGKQLMALSHIPRKDTILVGDTDHDLEVGNALGIEVILVDHGHQSFERLSAAHDKVVHYLGFEEGNKRSTGIR